MTELDVPSRPVVRAQRVSDKEIEFGIRLFEYDKQATPSVTGQFYLDLRDERAAHADTRALLAERDAEIARLRKSERDCAAFLEAAEVELARLRAALAAAVEALKLHEAWEAHVIVFADWGQSDGLPHLTQKQMDALNEVQAKRNAALSGARALTPPAEEEGERHG